MQIAARNATADSVTHMIHPCAREKKRELLCHLIKSRGLKQVLVFCGTRIGANRLAHQLRANHIQVDAIHGDKTQAEREAALDAFKTGKTTVLVATDVAFARPRHREPAAGDQFRHPALAGRLRAPHRPYRPRRPDRRGDLAGGAGRMPRRWRRSRS
ncbi:MAG: C-terminal helicase domain-containing protein [Verrucomicrobiota bacterium]